MRWMVPFGRAGGDAINKLNPCLYTIHPALQSFFSRQAHCIHRGKDVGLDEEVVPRMNARQPFRRRSEVFT